MAFCLHLHLLRLLPLESGDAASITSCILKRLQDDRLDIAFLVGIGVDNANVMTGSHNSVFTRLRQLQPNLILLRFVCVIRYYNLFISFNLLIRCVCHSLSLAASKAVEKLPDELDALIKKTYDWFSHSSKRKGHYNEVIN